MGLNSEKERKDVENSEQDILAFTTNFPHAALRGQAHALEGALSRV